MNSRINNIAKILSGKDLALSSLDDLSVVNRSKLIVLYDKDANIPKENKDSGVVYIKISQDILLAEISKTIIELLNDYIKYIFDKNPLAPGLKFNQNNLGEIKIRTSEYIQIQKYLLILFR